MGDRQLNACSIPTSQLLTGVTTYQALSDRFALPTYAQAGQVFGVEFPPELPSTSSLRTNIALLCMRSPSRVLTQSRTSSFGKSGECHHFR